ncbi:MAG TPA: hypothetical protein VG937_31820 [Polyangiaceae bacterium]|nr:hypothetical protein [Polyangiaceae bacterium]
MPPPVLGFNNNVRHRGRVFHIQTEDSGVKSPRIVTHLFADGGRIIKTTRTSYAELLSRGDLAQVVRQMMKDQHKSMFTALRTGDLDELLESSCGPLPLPATAPAAAEQPPAPAPAPAENRRPSGELLAPQAVIAVGPSAASSPASAPIPSGASARAGSSLTNPSMYKIPPSVVPPASREAIDLAVGALDKLGGEAPVSTVLRGPVKSEPAKARKSVPPGRKTRTPAAPAASARPASRYGSVPSKSARSIFGDGVISEKSLDEVILSYLAEDLEPSE